MRRCASVEMLMRLGIHKAIAREIRRVWKEEFVTEKAREVINTLVDGHGVEFLGVHRDTNADVHYCNKGDPYVLTIVFIGTQLGVAYWGYYIERKLVRPIQ